MTFRFLFASALAFAALVAPSSARAQASEPAPWLRLAGGDRDCTDIQVTIGGRICVAWTDRARTFILDKAGHTYQSIREHTYAPNQEVRYREMVRSGQLTPAEIRELRTVLAASGIENLRGQCNPFPDYQEFLELASYRLTWIGTGEAFSRIPFGTAFRNHPCPQALLRLLHRLNRITANLPEQPAL